ncbi:MAG: PilT/PilU family type 4a pilus ATPase [Nitrospinae bacterium]|nr:PilT/PilU family type 4a pilus ATPase [Nitrospinota bacterium]
MRKAEIDFILTTMLESFGNVSDLNLTVDKPLQVESSGVLTSVPITPQIEKLTPFQTEIFALNLMGTDRRLCENLVREGSCDSSYHLAGKARFRVNIFSQKNCYSIVMRRLSTSVPTIGHLNLPDVFFKMGKELNGLILVTGATGSGKSTTLAALLNEVNENKSIHVVTLEDPVEFVHIHKKATFNQRELGTDFDSFASGLRAALRQAPKVILVGEMRDRETVEIGLSAAETGHLVMSTLHTVDAGQTINRIVGMFDKDEEVQVRTRLADTIRWIVGQRLLPRVGGGRVAALEVMGANLRVKDTILNGESEGKTFYEIISGSRTFGMQTFDQSILDLYKDGKVTEETAMNYCSRKAIVSRGIDVLKSSRGEKTTDIEDLALDAEYGDEDDKFKKMKRRM